MHPLSGQEILFTRQRHEADRMGLHWDYRMVLGDKAYSWATKKEMPEPGKSILLFEQPVHDREYALSEKVVIPKGEYGGGTTYLDWVRKATVEPQDDEEKLVIATKDGSRFLLKKLDETKYGKGKPWLFKNLNNYSEGPNSTFTHDGSIYLVDDAIKKSKFSRIEATPISELDWVLENANVNKERLEKADIKVPILVTNWNGKKVVIDGTHRLVKAKSLQNKNISTKYVDTNTLEKQAKMTTEKTTEMTTNKYLVKIAMDPVSAFALHSLGSHVVQNLAMKKMLKSKMLAKHVANGFRQGIEGVTDTSAKSKITKFVAGATLPEVNSMYSAAHSMGEKMGPHLSNLNIKQKAALHQAVSGNFKPLFNRGYHESPEFRIAYGIAQKRLGLPDIEKVRNNTGKIEALAKSNPLIGNINKNIHRGDAPVGPHFKPGKPSAALGSAGGFLLSGLDPATGALNTVKNIAQSGRFGATSLGHKFVNKVHDFIAWNPLRKGLAGKVDANSKVKKTLNDLLITPVNSSMKEIGNTGFEINK
jgi:hypothetical protein